MSRTNEVNCYFGGSDRKDWDNKDVMNTSDGDGEGTERCEKVRNGSFYGVLFCLRII